MIEPARLAFQQGQIMHGIVERLSLVPAAGMTSHFHAFMNHRQALRFWTDVYSWPPCDPAHST